jgi:pyruvate/2-oxoglutarate dehydrogenase complex dihydrolipoamide dehydrogenase (E3) component
MTRVQSWDLVVIGGGPAGIAAASEAADLGASVLLIERHALGGTSLHTGSVPSRALARSASKVASARDADVFGARTRGSVRVDFEQVLARSRWIERRIGEGLPVFRAAVGKVEIVRGRAHFETSSSVRVGRRVVGFGRAIVATGVRPRRLPIRGLARVGYLTSDDVFDVRALPRRLAVVGGGPLGCELAQVFCRLGSRVTLIQDDAKFLPREERDASEILSRALARDGVEIRLGTRVVGARRSRGGKVLETLRDGASADIEADEILLSVGRVPNVGDLGLGAARIRHDDRVGIAVDDHLRTSARRVYAAGDVCSAHRFTHVAEAMGRMAAANALGASGRASDILPPRCTFTDPEIAHVGMRAVDAFDAGLPIESYAVMMHDVDRAITDGLEDGFVKIHVAAGTDRIVGATIVASRASEMIAELVLAMQNDLGMRAVAAAVHTYPAQANAIASAARAFVETRARGALGPARMPEGHRRALR